MRKIVLTALLLMAATLAKAEEKAPSLAGTWTLVAADVVHPDGKRDRDYGLAPQGLMMVDQEGRYSLQIFRSDRPRFAANDRKKGTPEEYSAAVLGSSTHFGHIALDPAAGLLIFKIDSASYPNFEGTEERRPYVLTGDELSYRTKPRPDGDVPVSVWRRVEACEAPCMLRKGLSSAPWPG